MARVKVRVGGYEVVRDYELLITDEYQEILRPNRSNTKR